MFKKIVLCFRGQGGFTLMDGLMVLGVSAAVLGITYIAAKPTLTTWWTTTILPLF